MLRHGALMMWMCHYLHICNFIIRDDNFHVAFSQIGDLRRIMLQNVRILALTAMDTSKVYKAVSILR